MRPTKEQLIKSLEMIREWAKAPKQLEGQGIVQNELGLLRGTLTVIEQITNETLKTLPTEKGINHGRP